MNIDTLVESFYKKATDEDLINEVLQFLITEAKKRDITLSWDGIPDIPISEIPWSSVETVEGEGADIPGPERQQLMQFLDDIEGDDLKDKIEGLSAFYDADPSALIDKTKDMTAKEKISAALGYLTFFKTLTKIIAHFNASSAGFSFEAFLGVLLGGTQIPASGADTIADLVDQQGVPISLKLYTEGQLKVGGSFTDLANDLRKYEQMQYVAVTKTLNDEKTSGRLDFYRFNFTLDNIGNILSAAGLHNPSLIMLPDKFVKNPEEFADIEIPAPPKEEELVELYTNRVKELGDASGVPGDILTNAVAAVGLPDDTSMLKGQKKRFGRDELPIVRSPKLSTGGNIKLAVRMGLLPEEPPPFPVRGGKAAQPQRDEWLETYGTRVETALNIYNNVVAAAYNDVVVMTRRNLEARQALVAKAGGKYLGVEQSVEVYNGLPTPALKKKALLLSYGFVNTEQFDLTQPRVLTVDQLAAPYPVFPGGQTEVKLGSIEVGQEKVVGLMKKVSQIIDESVFLIFEDLKVLTTNIQAYFGNGLKDDEQASRAIEASDSIGERTKELKDDEN
ncbi:hypothetical protein CMI37_23610 [Candidatus Pacearchaeota archaeon]|nr:hypothetical protein [Candidatus Pacearchaeota archaeon]